jgi:chemotaxis protein methyltransferase CheR
MKARPSITSGDFRYICDLVRQQSALALEPGKEYLVESRLAPLAHQEGFPSCHHMVRTLRVGPFRELHRKVVEAMTNNETSFFRDGRVFKAIARGILPTLVASRSAERSLSIWCAASSSGQEPYSIAMLSREHRPSLGGWNMRIIASDISQDVLGRARAGRYNQTEINRGLPANLLVKYFEQDGRVWTVCPEIRRMVEFHEINLIHAWPSLPRMQLILLRNVLIYFDVDTKKAILERIARLLDPHGYLFLGTAESTTNLDDSFEPVTIEGAVCFRRRH